MVDSIYPMTHLLDSDTLFFQCTSQIIRSKHVLQRDGISQFKKLYLSIKKKHWTRWRQTGRDISILIFIDVTNLKFIHEGQNNVNENRTLPGENRPEKLTRLFQVEINIFLEHTCALWWSLYILSRKRGSQRVKFSKCKTWQREKHYIQSGNRDALEWRAAAATASDVL